MKTIVFSVLVLSLQISHAANECASVPDSEPQIDQTTNKVIGCRLLAQKEDSLYTELGLKTGDVVRSDAPKSIEVLQDSEKQENIFEP